MGSIGITELVIVLVIVLLVFGPGRLGSIGSALGKGIRNFRSSLEGDDSSDDNDENKGSGGTEFRAPKN
ncbi:MAG: twin-arginine translocase TatA/TatE family subunit [Candidatus Mycalebacterium zealandia]|nr:MAG: twin-arginine translocase TatA/TatE family subunit [Candidatus Mycalebacterium zealandia]